MDAKIFHDVDVQIDFKELVNQLEADQRMELVAALGKAMAGDDFIDSFADHNAAPAKVDRETLMAMNDTGTKLMDLFVARAAAFRRLPDDYEPDWVEALRRDARRLHEAICEGRAADADEILRGIVPDHDFPSFAASKWLGDIRSRDLFISEGTPA